MESRGRIHFSSLPSWCRWLVQVLALAVVYHIVGRLGTLLIAPPISAAPVWPAAGVALAALLVFGCRIWPGVLLGSFLINVGMTGDAFAGFTSLKPALLALSIGAAASLEAVTGAFLIRRYGRASAWLLDPNGTVKFVIFAAVSCVIGATWATGTMLIAHVIQRGDLWFTWWAWLVGDSIGIITFTPLILVWAVRHPGLPRRRQLAVAVPLSVAFILITVFFGYTSAWEQDRIKLIFERRSERLTQQLKEQMENYMDVLRSLEAFHVSAPNVTRADFAEFTSRWFARYSGIGALSWIPRVTDSERAGYEERARADGLADFQITEAGANGRTVAAQHRREYFPVYFVESFSGTRRALGFDLASEPIRREALDRARDTGRAAASDPLTLIRRRESEPSFVVLVPVYKRGLPHATVEERRQSLQGYVSGAFQMRSILASLPGGGETRNILVSFRDAGKATSRLQNEEIAYNASALRAAAVEFNENGAILTRIVPFELAGRRWVVEFTSTRDFMITQRRWQGWTVLAAGLFFATLLAGSLLLLTGHAARLQLVNADLGDEMRERKSAEEALRRSNALKSAILEAALDCLITMDHSGNIVEFNPAAERTFGYRRNEAIGRPMSDLIRVPAARENHNRSLPEFLVTQVLGRHLETTCVRKDGSEFPVELAVARIALDGPPVFTGYIRDITERKRAHEAATKLGAIVQSSEDAIFSTVDGTVTSWNPGAERVYGYAAGEIIGRSVAILFPPDRIHELTEILTKLRSGEKISNYETVRMKKDGTHIPVSLTISPIRDANGHVNGVSTIARDISRRRSAEAELNRLRDTLAHVTRISTMGELAGSLAHELNQPLAAILSNAQAAQRFLGAGIVDFKELAEILDDIVQDNCRAVDVIRKMRALVKKEKLDFAPVDLKVLIADVVLLVHSNCVMRNVRVAAVVDENAPRGYGDKVQLQQVILNLLLNAFDAVKDVPEPERSVTISVRCREPEMLTIGVSDCGSGIPPEKLGEIFQPFYTTKTEGLGIGLSISRSIIAAHGGRLDVEPNPGRGVTFYFTIPVAREEEVGGQVTVNL